MKKHFITMCFFVSISVLLSGAVACNKHGHCVQWKTSYRTEIYCCKQGNGYCESTCTRTVPYKECTSFVCDDGYEKVKAKKWGFIPYEKCVAIEGYDEKMNEYLFIDESSDYPDIEAD